MISVLSPWMVPLLKILLCVMGLTLLLAFIRLVKGPSLPDRVVALDLMAYTVIGIIVLYCILTGMAIFLDAAITLALIAFFGRSD